jgi:hypothetical protein
MEEKNKEAKNEIEKDEKQDDSIVNIVRQVNKKELKLKFKKEIEQNQKFIHEEDEKHNEYEKISYKDKVNIIKLKQGAVKKEEIGLVDQQVKVKYNFKDKLSNFIYHNKTWILLFLVFSLISGFLIYDLASRKRPDITILLLSADGSLGSKSEDIEHLFEKYIYDVNKNKKIEVSVFYLPTQETATNAANYQLQMANSSKLYAELQSSNSLIIISDSRADEIIFPENIFYNLEDDYGDNEAIKGYSLLLEKTKFAEMIGYNGTIYDDLYIGIRKPNEKKKMQKNFNIYYDALKKFIDESTD